MLSNHKLLIDQDCPLCKGYGKGFTKWGLLDLSTLDYYQSVDHNVFTKIDQERAKSEVALVDMTTGETTYGIDSLLKIVSHEKGWLQRFFAQKWFYWLVSKLYRFISFNRHVIAGESAQIHQRSCVPSMHYGYRWIYLLLTAFLTGLMVNNFSVLLDAQLGLVHQTWREYAICFGQIIWQFSVLTYLNPAKRMAYLGNMSTVSLIGGILLLPLFGLNWVIELPLFALLSGFGAVVLTMFWLHLKRCKGLGLPLIVSISWIGYRTLVLIIILMNLN